ncbi:hypothetical protein [Oceanicaulis sp.]|uniref:hypothetical protein n=1 Tax=Oceanicaulis sp. TaxID=1924941 RepID=UPI003BAA33D2
MSLLMTTSVLASLLAHPASESAVTGRVVAVDFTQEPALVEAFGGRRFYVEDDSGAPHSRLEWIAYDCQGGVMARTYPYDPRWSSGGHEAADETGALGPRIGAGLGAEPLEDADATLPVDTAQFEILERDEQGETTARHGPYDMPGAWCE